MKKARLEIAYLDRIVGGGQALGVLRDGKKIFVWGGLPGETVRLNIVKEKRSYAEGIVEEVLESSKERVEPQDPESYLSTSPWQIMTFESEQHYKALLIEEACRLHNVLLPKPSSVYSDGRQFHYRNKVEFSWWWDTQIDQLELAFFKRGSHVKMPVEGTSLGRQEINDLAAAIRNLLRNKQIEARALKSLLIRCDQSGRCCWQLYVKRDDSEFITEAEASQLPAQGGEIIYSDPRSPASRITKRLALFGDTTLHDEIMGTPFQYPPESFFQVNVPVYETALRDMARWIESTNVVDMYSGVGTIGLTIGGPQVTLVELDEHAFLEMKNNIAAQAKNHLATAVHALSEKALDYIRSDSTIIVDPPRAGLHQAVTDRLMTVCPPRILYLSCNPVTQARDLAQLLPRYRIVDNQGYNFFPRTPHIEQLIILDRNS